MEISINQALQEKALLDQKIQQIFTKNTPLAKAVSKDQFDSESTKVFRKNAQATSDKVLQLVQNRRKLKAAIVNSNANTMVTIAGEEMTVADAVERRKSIAIEQNVLNYFSNHRTAAQNSFDSQNSSMLSDKAHRAAIEYFGSQESANTEEYKEFVAEYMKNRASKMVMPDNFDARIEKLTDFIEQFQKEANFKINESNTVTKIDIDL